MDDEPSSSTTVFLVKKPRTVTCEELNSAKITFPVDDEDEDCSKKTKISGDSHSCTWVRGDRLRKTTVVMKSVGAGGHLKAACKVTGMLVIEPKIKNVENPEPLMFVDVRPPMPTVPPNVRLRQTIDIMYAVTGNPSTSKLLKRKRPKSEPITPTKAEPEPSVEEITTKKKNKKKSKKIKKERLELDE